MSEFDKLIKEAGALLGPAGGAPAGGASGTDWKSIAFRWRKRRGNGAIEAVRHVHKISLNDLCGIDGQKKVVEQNTQQFVDQPIPPTIC